MNFLVILILPVFIYAKPGRDQIEFFKYNKCKGPDCVVVYATDAIVHKATLSTFLFNPSLEIYKNGLLQSASNADQAYFDMAEQKIYFRILNDSAHDFIYTIK